MSLSGLVSGILTNRLALWTRAPCTEEDEQISDVDGAVIVYVRGVVILLRRIGAVAKVRPVAVANPFEEVDEVGETDALIAVEVTTDEVGGARPRQAREREKGDHEEKARSLGQVEGGHDSVLRPFRVSS